MSGSINKGNRVEVFGIPHMIYSMSAEESAVKYHLPVLYISIYRNSAYCGIAHEPDARVHTTSKQAVPCCCFPNVRVPGIGNKVTLRPHDDGTDDPEKKQRIIMRVGRFTHHVLVTSYSNLGIIF